MPAVKTGMTPPPMPGMPAPMQPMGGMPPAQNPFAPMPPMPLAGMPPPSMPPMAQGQMPQGQGQQMMVSTAGRRRRFGDALEGMLGRNQGIGAAMPQQQRPMPQMMPQQRMVAPGTPMMKTPPMQSMTARPMAMGGEVDIFGYADGGIVQYMSGGGTPTNVNQYASGTRPNMREFMDATGASVEDAVSILYGTVGSNVDVRDWDAIMSSDNPIAAARDATRQMYTSGDAASLSTGTGQSSVPGSTGSGVLEDSGYNYRVLGNDIFLVDERGAPIAGIAPNRAANFGLTQADIDQALMAAGIDMESEYARRFQNKGYDMQDYDNLLVDYSNLQRGRNQPVVSDNVSSSGDTSSGVVSSDDSTNEYKALYGPDTSNITATTSQYVQNPVTGELTTTNGSTMTAVSPIGSITLPASPVDINIFDWLGEPTYGSLLDKQVEGMRDGGAVPRQTMIGDQPHMLAYINPQEADLLKDLGGSGEPGPGGIPAYRDLDADMYAGSKYGPTSNAGTSSASQSFTNVHTGETFSSASDLYDSYDFDDDDNNSSSGTVKTSAKDADLGVGGSDKTVTADQLSSGTGTTTYDTDDGGSVTVATGSTIDDVLSTASSGGGGGGGSSVMDVIAPSSVYTPPPPVYTDRFGREYGTQTEADIANQMYANQLASYGAGKVGFDRFKADAASAFPGRSREETDRMAARAYPDFVEDYSRDLNIFDADVPQPFTYAGIGGIGAGPEGGDLGITPTPTYDPGDEIVVRLLGGSPTGEFDLLGLPVESGQPVVGLGEMGLRQPAGTPTSMYDIEVGEDYTPSSADLARQLRDAGLTDQRVSSGFDTGLMQTGTGETYLQNIIDKADENGNITVFVQGVRTPVNVNDPDQVAALAASLDRGNTLDYYDEKTGLFNDLQAEAALERAGRPIVSPDRDDPRGDQIVSPTGTGTGLQSDLQRGLGGAGIIAARDADMDPFGTGTQVSLQDVKDRVARAEGTADEGGYGRLLGGQEGRFGVDLTNMTVQEVLDFQKQRGPGSYAEYSQGVNEQRGMTRADGSGVISTPAGKYQVVGATLEDLIDKGVVDPNAKFDEGTQEKIGSYLIAEKRGLNDLQAGNITREQFEENLGKEFEGIERGLDKGAGSTALTIGAASETGRQVEVDRRDANVEKIKKQIGDQAEPTGGEKFFYDFVGQLGFGLGKPLADKLRGASREDRQAIIDQHLYALENGATPKTDEEGNYIGFDISTMDTFADKVLGAEDIATFMPPSMAGGTFTVTQDMIDSLRASGLNAQADALTVGQKLNLPTTTNTSYQADADGDGVTDYDRFQQIIEAQQVAADAMPKYDNFIDYLLGAGPAGSTEQGFITSDGKEYFVDATGNVVEVTDGVVPFEVGGGDDVTDIFTTTTMTDDGGDDDTTTTTTDDTGHKDGVCNNPDYVYNPETDKCEPKKEEETDGDLGSPITTAITPRSFDEVLRSVVVPAPRIAPISENIRPMQGGGMAGLNRAADNFLKALAG